MNVTAVILVGVAGAAIGFFLGYWVGLLVRPKDDPAVTPPVMGPTEVQKLRETVVTMESQIERLERQVKG